MKTENVVLIGLGLAVAGYAAYKFWPRETQAVVPAGTSSFAPSSTPTSTTGQSRIDRLIETLIQPDPTAYTTPLPPTQGGTIPPATSNLPAKNTTTTVYFAPGETVKTAVIPKQFAGLLI